MSKQPKYKLGEVVNVSFDGKISTVRLTYKGDIEYRIVDQDKGIDAYVTEPHVSILQLIPNSELKKITCKVCGLTFGYHEFGMHMFEDGTLRKDHDLPADFDFRDHNKECFFCDGKIITHSSGPESWCTECAECGFLYDED